MHVLFLSTLIIPTIWLLLRIKWYVEAGGLSWIRLAVSVVVFVAVFFVGLIGE